jgi:hypothetical protein
MDTRDWLPGMTIELDPDAVEDYEMDFTAWLDGEVGITATVEPQNCTAILVSDVDSAAVTFRVSEVTNGATVTLRVESASGRVNNFTTYFTPVEQ